VDFAAAHSNEFEHFFTTGRWVCDYISSNGTDNIFYLFVV
jgi:hypothetical protein